MSKSAPVRQVVIDIETTGTDPAEGHRVVEIAAVEMIDRRITGRLFHSYVNPKREVDLGAQSIHGLSGEFLQDKPEFFEIAGEFLDFVRGAELLAHNAPFDVGFLDCELGLLEVEYLSDICPRIIDTLQLAKTLRPEQRNDLSTLCSDYRIESPDRTLFGASLDAQLLAQVYLVISHQLLH